MFTLPNLVLVLVTSFWLDVREFDIFRAAILKCCEIGIFRKYSGPRIIHNSHNAAFWGLETSHFFTPRKDNNHFKYTNKAC